MSALKNGATQAAARKGVVIVGQGILLESGINELEILVFHVGDSLCGTNVAKVDSIISHQQIFPVPNSSRFVKGVISHRGKVIPVLDLVKALDQTCTKPEQERLLISLSINNSDFAIEVSGVEGIRRLSWKDIETPSPILSGNQELLVTGIVNTRQDGIILILDLEKLLVDIDPGLALKESKETEGLEGKKIIIAEDSAFLLKTIGESLKKAGAIIETFKNGKLALDYLLNNPDEQIYCVITDIEMPVMDGLTLTKQIKTSPTLKQIPVVLFSSIVSEKLRHQGESVGADAQVTKPEIDKLVDIVKKIRKD